MLILIFASASASTQDSLREVQALESKFSQDPKRWSSDMSIAVFRLATEYFRERKFAEAKAAYLRSNDLDVKNTGRASSTCLIGAGQCCVELRQYAEAEKYLEQALRIVHAQAGAKTEDMAPGVVTILLSLAHVYENTNRIDKAEQTYRKVAEDVLRHEGNMVQAISSPIAFDSYAQFLERQNKSEEAEKWYARVAKLRANSHAYGMQSDCLRHYAAMLRKQKRNNEAIAMERRADELAKTHKRQSESGLDY